MSREGVIYRTNTAGGDEMLLISGEAMLERAKRLLTTRAAVLEGTGMLLATGAAVVERA